MRISAPSSRVQIWRSGIEHDDVANGLDVAGGDSARALLLHDHALGAFALHLDRDVLDVQHDVGDVLTDASDRGELVQHAVDVHRLHRRALERGEQDATQRVAERLAETTLERLGDDGRESGSNRCRAGSGACSAESVLANFSGSSLFHPYRPVDLKVQILALEKGRRSNPRLLKKASRATMRPQLRIRRADACADGNRCAGSWSRRGSR